MMGLHDPGGELGQKLLKTQPDVGEFASGDVVGCREVAVVEEVFVEEDDMVWVDFDGDNLCVAGVGELGPTIDSVPVFAKARAVVEDDLCGDGENEVSFATQVNGGEVLDLLLVFRFGEPPLDGIGG